MRSESSQTIVVDGRPRPLADAVMPLLTAREAFGPKPLVRAPIPFRISADGSHVIWAGVFDGTARPVPDDEVGPAFDLILEVVGNGRLFRNASCGRRLTTKSLPSISPKFGILISHSPSVGRKKVTLALDAPAGTAGGCTAPAIGVGSRERAAHRADNGELHGDQGAVPDLGL